MLGLFSLSGKIDGILIESKEIRSYQIVSKVQGGKYGQISESFSADSKPMFLANLCCAYLKNVYVRCGVPEISGADSLINKSDKT